MYPRVFPVEGVLEFNSRSRLKMNIRRNPEIIRIYARSCNHAIWYIPDPLIFTTPETGAFQVATHAFGFPGSYPGEIRAGLPDATYLPAISGIVVNLVEAPSGVARREVGMREPSLIQLRFTGKQRSVKLAALTLKADGPDRRSNKKRLPASTADIPRRSNSSGG